MNLEAGKATLGARAFWNNQFPVVGVTGGKAVSSAAVLMVDGHRYVALVATDPVYATLAIGGGRSWAPG